MGRRSGTCVALLASALLAIGCGGDAPERVRLIEGERSPSPDQPVRLSFQSPVPGTLAPDRALGARLALTGFRLGEPTPGAEDRGLALSEDGQHVHFIVDNEPYRAIYDVSGRLGVEVDEAGVHVLRAFPSRQWHESVKSEDAFAVTWFYVPPADPVVDTARGPEPTYDPGAPLLTYSRPKGTYAGSGADSVMVDFYLTNVTIGPEPGSHRVRLTVDDTLSWDLTRWVPHYLLGLSEGEHTVQLELIAPDSTVVEGPYNTTERTITIRRSEDGG